MGEANPYERWPERENDVRQLSGVDDLEPKFPKAHRAVTNHAAPRNPILCPSPGEHTCYLLVQSTTILLNNSQSIRIISSMYLHETYCPSWFTIS